MISFQQTGDEGSGKFACAYEAGKQAAIYGKTLRENPYLYGNDPETERQFWAWLNGFRDYQTFDPSCRYCAGTGHFSLSFDKENLPHRGCSTNLRCSCNIGKLKKTDTGSNDGIEKKE